MNTNVSNRTNIGRIVTFLVLTFGLSTIFYTLIIRDGEYRGPWLTPLMLCPTISAILTKLVFDRNLKGLGWTPGPAKWLGLAYLLPILYGAVIYGIVWLFGLGGINADAIAMVTSTQFGMPNASGVQMTVMVIVYALLLGTIQLLRYSLLSAFGEELGWRGFLFPELHRMTSFTTASLISGVVWALFHLPLILFSDYNSTAPIAFQVVVFFISAIGGTFVYNWLRAKSGSMWPAVVFHASHNVFLNNVLDPLTTRYPLTDLFVTEFGLGMLVINVLLALYVWRHRSELDPKPETAITMTVNQPTAAD
jgi:membrane protease YdiL (CAAX protease family)